ncbi:MAG: histidine kinase [Bacteroidales bacterium]|nr:histidine kinase [Bacteroidales bacterium]
MRIIRPDERKESTIYLIAWVAVFVLSAVRIAIECIAGGEEAIDFVSIFQTWLMLLPFLLLFCVHNFFIAPQLVYNKRTALYVIATGLLLAAFFAYYLLFYPGPNPGLIPPEPDGRMQGPPPGGSRGRPMDPDLLRGFLGVFLLAANLGIKFLFSEQRERERLQQLEKENLAYQLEYLRYQINPHFFMNTLNNIHALVDIDPEMAKLCIIELSKMMRHILYDSDKPTIPLSQELDFLDNYISLMRIRYPDDASIDYSRPVVAGPSEVPPLVFASFVENAFKHGMGSPESFVCLSIKEDDGKVVFKCVNSRKGAASGGEKGIGLQNIRRRLELLYGTGYNLQIEEDPDLFDVLLEIPSKPKSE